VPSNRPVDVHGIPVHGVDVHPDTRCAHYATDRDVIAIKFACCGDYYPCLQCHDTLADHDRDVWPVDEFDTAAILCGSCGTEHTIETYRDSGSSSPTCDAEFNPGCRRHWSAYFARVEQ